MKINSSNKILLVPHYLGSARYLAGIIKLLEKKYELCFLFTPKIKEKFLPEIIAFCQKNHYPYYLIRKPKVPEVIQKIPLIYQPLIVSFHYRIKIRQLLKNIRPRKIIATNDTNFFHNYLMKKATEQNIETFVLQWAMISERKIPRKDKQKIKIKKPFLKIIPCFLNRLLIKLTMPSMNSFKTLGGGKSQKLGVINQKSSLSFQREGIPKEKISVVGSLDFGLAEKLQKDLKGNKHQESAIAKKYGINQNKINIAVFSNPFNLKDVSSLSDAQQFELFKNAIKIIREIFLKNEADILFKIHPAENENLYKPLEKYGVKIFSQNAINEELIYFSDLYISYFSTTNLIPIAMQKPAIFLNFFKLIGAEQTKTQKFVENKHELKKLLSDFKINHLEPQYQITQENFTPNSLEKILSWIG